MADQVTKLSGEPEASDGCGAEVAKVVPGAVELASTIGNRAMRRLVSRTAETRMPIVELASTIGNRATGRLLSQTAGNPMSRLLLRYGHDVSTCTQEDVEKRIWPGDYFARQIVDKTLAVLARDTPPPYLRGLFKEYFGAETADIAEIRRNFAALRQKFSDSDYMYSCSHDCESTKEEKTLGKTNVGRWGITNPSGPLILCMNSLSAQIDPVRMTAQTIIHEMGHRYLPGFTGDKYCDSDCSTMPPDEAMKNTDSYASFALAVWDREDVEEHKARKRAEQGG